MSKGITIQEVKDSIRDIPDFPKPGIIFKDVTTAMKDPAIFRYVVDKTVEHYKDLGITKVVGVESRGFIFGSALAYHLNAGFVPVRKPGKLPADVISQSYDLEYGSDTLEMHRDSLNEDDVILIHDDLLATGGTVCATIELVKQSNVKKIYTNFFVELEFLKGEQRIGDNAENFSFIKF